MQHGQKKKTKIQYSEEILFKTQHFSSSNANYLYLDIPEMKVDKITQPNNINYVKNKNNCKTTENYRLTLQNLVNNEFDVHIAKLTSIV